MGWSNWFSSGNGGETKVKTEKSSDGSKTTHFLNTTGGSRKNHSHTVVKSGSDGKAKSAHHTGLKDQRK